MSRNKPSKQEEMIAMFNMYRKLPKEKQAYVSGIIAGLAAKHDISTARDLRV
ncbi:hypothetical protein G8T71_10505 [Clostridium botulinum C/D]|uniref:hypothetical protein n=1 Tax=Clostridium botulinum TaxID=1491 RepID=UPI001E5285CE|nr:hypothetical protein [Clostridium botulinum]MCD3211785.1 hypothetical protein [Clostridium botulinum C/D]